MITFFIVVDFGDPFENVHFQVPCALAQISPAFSSQIIAMIVFATKMHRSLVAEMLQAFIQHFMQVINLNLLSFGERRHFKNAVLSETFPCIDVQFFS